MTQSEIDHIKRSAQQAKEAMIRHEYDQAHELLKDVPGEFGVKMALLVIEHEVGYRRSMGEVI